MQDQKWPNVDVENLTNTAFLYSIHTVAKVTPKEVQNHEKNCVFTDLCGLSYVAFFFHMLFWEKDMF